MTMIYNKPARQMLVDLINEGNPDLPFRINGTDYEFTRPEAIDPLPNGHNTQIRILTKTTAPYHGNVLLTYRRLNLASLFRNVVPEIKQWVSNNGNVNGNNIIAYLHDFLPQYSKKYGILLEPSQIRNVSLRNYHGLRGDTFNITAESDSVAFVGSTVASWWLGRRTLEDLLQVDELEGRRYPDGNDFSGEVERKHYLTPLTHNIDFTMYHQENGSDWDRYNDQFWRVSSSAYRRQEDIYTGILDSLFRENFGFGIRERQYTTSHNYTQPIREIDGERLVGMRFLDYRPISLPHPDYPEANSEFFNSAIVIEVPEDCPWGTGNIYLHYNK